MAERDFSCVDKDYPTEGYSDGYLSAEQVEEIYREGPDLLDYYIEKYYPGLPENQRSNLWLELLNEIARKTDPDVYPTVSGDERLAA